MQLRNKRKLLSWSDCSVRQVLFHQWKNLVFCYYPCKYILKLSQNNLIVREVDDTFRAM